MGSCKEAASKAMGLGMLKDFKELRVAGDRNGRFSVVENGKEPIHGNYVFFRNFVVAIGHRRLRISDGTDSPFKDSIESLI